MAPLTGLGDFTADRRLLFIAALAVCTGIIGVGLAIVLLDLIKLWTNLFFFQRLSLEDVAPRDAHVGLWVIPIAVGGAMIVGLMARFGSDRIRGHGIPEAIEVILLQGSRVRPRVALLKPVSAAISIGSGGPFGAEGPIIMTGGACGSLFAQLIHLSDAERKTLMVSGAAAGMSAIFATPMAAILLAVELLLFEWKPRSLIPVAVASITAYTLRWYAIGHGPIFPLETALEFGGPAVFLSAVFLGITAGCVGAALTQLIYLAEDTFGRLPFHWMWWPALGGLVIGVGGYFFPRALGVGYGTIEETLNGELALKVVLGVLVVKSLIWSISLGSGTSGGVLAPLLMIGASLGAVESHVLPEGAAFWAAIGMAAVMGGTMRAPLTAVIFAIELTHDLNLLVPLLIGVAASYAFTVLTMKRSILTEKISRRGFHLSSEYSVDPLELQLVRDAMQPSIPSIEASAAAADLQAALREFEAGPFLVG
ncbi:MAG: chloride channel protein, partial [Dehalococcoidia bacterium]